MKWGQKDVRPFFTKYSAILDQLVPQLRESRYKKDKDKDRGLNNEELISAKKKRAGSPIDIPSDLPVKRAKEKSAEHPCNLLDELATVVSKDIYVKHAVGGESGYSGLDGGETASSLDPNLEHLSQTVLPDRTPLDLQPGLYPAIGPDSQIPIALSHSNEPSLDKNPL